MFHFIAKNRENPKKRTLLPGFFSRQRANRIESISRQTQRQAKPSLADGMVCVFNGIAANRKFLVYRLRQITAGNLLEAVPPDEEEPASADSRPMTGCWSLPVESHFAYFSPVFRALPPCCRWRRRTAHIPTAGGDS